MFKRKKCSECGADNNKKDNYCKKCGKGLPALAKLSTPRVLNVVLAFVILGMSTVYAADHYNLFSRYHLEQPKAEADKEKAPNPLPYTCPSGTHSPKGGSINWDGSTTCDPDAAAAEDSSPPVRSNPQAPTTQSTSNEMLNLKKQAAKSKEDYYNNLIKINRDSYQQSSDAYYSCVQSAPFLGGPDPAGINQEMETCQVHRERMNKLDAEKLEYEKQADEWYRLWLSYF